MTNPALQSPGGIYWRAVLYATANLSMPLSFAVQSTQWPSVACNINMPLLVGSMAPVSVGVSMPLQAVIIAHPAVVAAANINMPLGAGVSTKIPAAISMPLTVTAQAQLKEVGQQLNTTVSRSDLR